MKKTILILLLIGFFQVSFCQYKSVFGNDSTQWNVLEVIADMAHTRFYKAYKDTIVSDLHYYLVYEIYLYTTSKTPICFLREDTINGKLWSSNEVGKSERLIMDINLSKKDAFLINKNVADIVNTILYKDKKKIVVFNEKLRYSGDTLKFIEGVGPNIIFASELNFNNFTLLCSYRDGIQIYKFDKLNKCIIGFTGIDLKSINNKVTIYPNPCQNKIEIKTNSNANKSFDIYNVNGILYKRIYLNSAQQKVDISSFPKGVYFIKNYGQIFKLIKN